MDFKIIINYIILHRQEICYCLFIFFFFLAAGFIEQWLLLPALVSFLWSIGMFILGTLWSYKRK